MKTPWSFASRTTVSLLMLAVLAALFAAGAVTVTRAFRAEDSARRDMIAARDALAQVDDLLLLLLEADLAQRGPPVVAPGADLAPFLAAQAALPGLLDEVQGALAQAEGDLPRQGQRLRTLAEQRMAEMAAAIAPLSTDPPAVDTRASMTELREVGSAIRAEQRARMDAAYAAADAERLRAKRTLGMIGLATLGLMALAALLAFRAARIESRVRYMQEIEAQRDRADLVSHELSHRVKNLFAVIMSIVSVTARREPDPKIAAKKTRARIQALARAHEISSGQNLMRTALFGDLVDAVVRPYCPPDNGMECSGPELLLPARLITPMGLIFNELATNSVKYGAWSAPSGTLRVHWAFASGETLNVVWQEHLAENGPPPPGREGFGSTMIDLSLQQARATMEKRWGKNGLTATLSFPFSKAEIAEAAATTGKD